MSKKIRTKKKNKSLWKRIQHGGAGNILVMGIVLLMVGAGYTMTGGVAPNDKNIGTEQVQIVTPVPQSKKSNLQLETFGYATPAPTVKPLCAPNDDNGVLVTDACQCLDLTIICKNGKGTDLNGNPFQIPKGDEPNGYKAGQDPCGTKIAPNDGRYCVAKPVIYLYPQSPTAVDVQVVTSGQIVVSDPHYPQGGWRNVLATPEGTLTYNGKQYSELFYESSVNDFQKPEQGITIAKAQLPQRMSAILDKLGLIGKEKQEFLDFWLPKLQALPSPYVYFSLLDTSAKASVDKVTINPKPDTQIAFIAYFKPVDSADNGTVLQLPATPQRVGFVSVEWGGTIDTK